MGESGGDSGSDAVCRDLRGVRVTGVMGGVAGESSTVDEGKLKFSNMVMSCGGGGMAIGKQPVLMVFQ
jgi:hypothetical protein